MSSFILNRFYLGLLLFYTTFLVSCGGGVVTPPPGGGGNGPTAPDVVVSISPSPATVAVNESVTFVATVTLNGTTAKATDQRLYWWISTPIGSSIPFGPSTTYTYTAASTPTTRTLTGQSYLNITDSATAAITVGNKNGGVTSPGSLTIPRIGHTATLLQDGTVLIVGEYNTPISPVFLSSGELYNYTTKQFSANSSSVVYGRAFHSATLLPGGKVLIAKGRGAMTTDGVLNSNYAYNPLTQQFDGAGYPNPRRANHTSTLLPNGNVLLAGGTDGNSPLTSAESYNIFTFQSSSSYMFSPRMDHTATLLKDGTVLVTGGNNGTNNLASFEIFNPTNSLFTTSSQIMATTRAGHTATLLPDGSVLIAGGIVESKGFATTSAEIYSLGKFTSTGRMSTPIAFHTATALSDGSVLIAGGGGVLISGSPAFVTSVAEIYSPAAKAFLPTSGLMNNARVNHTATLLPTGEVLISGGFDGTDALSSAEIYSP